MNVSLISNDTNLHKALESIRDFKVTINNDLHSISDYDVILISDKEIAFNELNIFLEMEYEKNMIHQDIFYMLSNSYNEQMMSNISIICKTKNIFLIPPKLTLSQIIERVRHNVFPNQKEECKNIVVFFGADNKTGTTMIAQSVAEILSEYTDLSIMLLFLNGDSSDYYVKNNKNKGLDELKIKLMNHILSIDEIKDQSMKLNEHLSILKGVDQILDMRHYHPEHIDQLIQLVSASFDLVIIDAGYNLDSGMAVASLNATKNKYLVTTQQEITKLKFEKMVQQLFEPLHLKSNDFLLVVNKYLQSNQILSARQIAEKYNMTLAAFIPHLEFIGWQAEYDHKTLLHYNNESYNLQIKKLSKLIAEQNQIHFKDTSIRKESILRKVLHSLGGML